MPYQGVKKLTAGSYAVISTTDLSISITRWWDISKFYLEKSKDSFEQALEKTDGLLKAAVKRRIESSDLEVGSFLSGGIDSSSVVAYMSQILDKPVKTFSIGFEEDKPTAAICLTIQSLCSFVSFKLYIYSKTALVLS